MNNHALEESFGFAHGAVDFLQHTRHWQFVGDVRGILTAYEEIDPDKVDGVIGWFSAPESACRLIRSGIATVGLASDMTDSTVPRVCLDVESVGRTGAEYLLERGFDHFAFAGTVSTDGRVDAFQDGDWYQVNSPVNSPGAAGAGDRGMVLAPGLGRVAGRQWLFPAILAAEWRDLGGVVGFGHSLTPCSRG